MSTDSTADAFTEGAECPACGAPYCPGESGYYDLAMDESFDAITWVRVCVGKDPSNPHAESPSMLFVHTDEHIDVMDDDFDEAHQ